MGCGEEVGGGVPGRDTQKAVDLDVVDRLPVLEVAADVVDVDSELVQLPDELVGMGLG